jgi:hypothetical protein
MNIHAAVNGNAGSFASYVMMLHVFTAVSTTFTFAFSSVAFFSSPNFVSTNVG